MEKVKYKCALVVVLISLISLQFIGCTGDSNPVGPGNGVLTDNQMKTGIDSTVNKVVTKYSGSKEFVGVSVGIFKGGSEYYYNYGEAIKGSSKLATKNTLYEIGSLTKTFTGGVMASLIREGMLDPDAPITNYLPEGTALQSFGGVSTTLRTLASHSGGFEDLPSDFLTSGYDASNPFNHYDTSKVYNYLTVNRLTYTPGSKVAYSNFGMALVGIICARVTGKSYEILVKERILNPLEMYSSRINSLTDKDPIWSKGYNEKLQSVPRITATAFQGSGFLSSDISEMMKYAKSQLGFGNEIIASILKRTQETQIYVASQEVAYGWDWVSSPELGNFFHDGRTPGYRSFLLFNTKTKTAVICLFNSSGTAENSHLDALFYELATAILN